jgi:hypothetical protein
MERLVIKTFSYSDAFFVGGSLAWSKSAFCNADFRTPPDIDCIMHWNDFIQFVSACGDMILHIAEVWL